MLHNKLNSSIKIPGILVILISITLLAACYSKKDEPTEEISITERESKNENEADTLLNSIDGNVALSQIATTPNDVILTGLSDHRLVTVYKAKAKGNYRINYNYSSDYSSNLEWDDLGALKHFMPGIDILYGYNLLNIAHYDLKTEKLNFLFGNPTLIKTLYYPCLIQDSLNNKPINRDYYLISVYDEDTNKDTLINKKDLRRFYHFNASCNIKTQLIPTDYSVIRSQYDSQNDVMYIFAIQDSNKNGTGDKTEPVHIFWISLKSPLPAKRLY